MSVHDESVSAAKKSESTRKPAEQAKVDAHNNPIGNQKVRNAAFATKQREKIYGK